jgi:DNA replication protein DnaC
MSTLTLESLKSRAQELGLWGIVSNWETLATEPCLPDIIQFEEQERTHRSLLRRTSSARLGQFKPMSSFNWSWPKENHEKLVTQLFSLEFIEEPANVILVGPSGVGKTMIAKNLAQQALKNGKSALFISASALLNDLAACETISSRNRRFKYYATPHLLVIDELGYLASSNKHADLLFEVVNQRYEKKPIVITTNKPFGEWSQVFPNTSGVVALIDRLIHRAEVITINAESFRLKEAQERAAAKPGAQKIEIADKSSAIGETTA